MRRRRDSFDPNPISSLNQSKLQPQEEKRKEFSHEQLLAALYFVLDLFSRPNLPFFLLDSTAKSVKDNLPLEGEALHVGIRNVDFQDSSLSILNAFKGADEIGDNFIKYTHNEVPVIVHVVKDHDGRFTSTDPKLYFYEYFNLPNPFDTYWNERGNYG